LPELFISKVETFNTNTFSIDAAQAQLWAQVSGLVCHPEFGLA